jgi:hypothetical protein
MRALLLLLILACLALPGPAGAALWKAERAWDEAEEAAYGEWIEKNVDADFFVRAHLAHDCADILYGLRWIYARERRLPVAATGADGVVVGHWSDVFAPAGRGDWKRDAHFLAALRIVFGLTGTRTLPVDTYPIAIDREHVHAGVLYRAESHAYVVGRVALDGTEPHPLVTWESTLPPAVRPLREGVFAPSAPALGSGDGLRRFYWVEHAQAGWRLVPPERQSGYSDEQYAPRFVADHPFAEAVARRLEYAPAPPMIRVLGYIAQADRLARERVPIVVAGHKACGGGKPKDSCREGGALWELYSTPNRDARLIGYLARVRALAEDRDVEPEWVMSLLRAKVFDVRAPIFPGEGEEARMLSLVSLYEDGRFVSSEPGDSIAKRWGQAVCESLADRATALEGSLTFLRERATDPNDTYTQRAIESNERELALVAGDRKKSGCSDPPLVAAP